MGKALSMSGDVRWMHNEIVGAVIDRPCREMLRIRREVGEIGRLYRIRAIGDRPYEWIGTFYGFVGGAVGIGTFYGFSGGAVGVGTCYGFFENLILEGGIL